MSTTYVIFRRSIRVEAINGFVNTVGMEEGRDYLEIGRTRSFLPGLETVISFLSDETPVYAIDNDTDIATLGALRRHYGFK